MDSSLYIDIDRYRLDIDDIEIDGYRYTDIDIDEDRTFHKIPAQIYNCLPFPSLL